MHQSLKATEAWAKLLECAELRDVMAMLVDDLHAAQDLAEGEGRDHDAGEIVAARELVEMARERLPKGA
jgi:hypothetical protein